MISSGRHMRSSIMKSARNKWIALFSACMLLVVLGFGGAIALRLRANLHTNELNIGDYQGALENGALDILVIGSDTRAGTDGSYGEDDGKAARADVMMLLHISKDRKNVNVLSFPRDLILNAPTLTAKCTPLRTAYRLTSLWGGAAQAALWRPLVNSPVCKLTTSCWSTSTP